MDEQEILGIYNPRNNCFMNATMQCLMNLPFFNTFIYDNFNEIAEEERRGGNITKKK